MTNFFKKYFSENLKLDLLLASIGHCNECLDLLDGDVVCEVEGVAACSLAPCYILSNEVVMPNLRIYDLRYMYLSIETVWYPSRKTYIDETSPL